MPQPNQELYYRTIPIILRADDGIPASLDESTRSVEVTGATENPVLEFDWERWEMIPTILRMDCMIMPSSRQVSLLDCHSRFSVANILGSYREMAIEMAQLIGRSHFSTVEEAENAYTKIKEGHLTDFSIGYTRMEATYIKEGETATVGGKSYTGPVVVVTKWQPRELSCCPIGADEFAKVRAAHINTKQANQPQEVRNMPNPIVDNNRNTPQVGETPPAVNPAQPQRQEPAQPAVDTDAIREEAARAERERVAEITALCDRAGLPENIRKELIGDGKTKGKTIEDAQRAALDHMCDNSPNIGHRTPIEMGADERDKFRSAAEDALILRIGNTIIEKPAAGARDLMGYSMREMAREFLRRARQPITGGPYELCGRALSFSDFPIVLANTANKELFAGWETAEQTYRDWVGTGTANDLKQHTSVRLGEYDDLLQILEEGEYISSSRTEGKEVYQLAKYGRKFALTLEAIINDDLGVLSDTPRGFGESVTRLEGDVVYAVLTANAALNDGVALFHADHANLGTAGAPSETTLAEGIKLMKQQKGIGDKSYLNIMPRFYIAPVALEGSSEIFFNSGQFAGANAAATRNNPYAGNRFTRVYEPRLDASSETEWYLAGAKGKTVKLVRLSGQEQPYMESRVGFDVDGIEFKIRHFAAAYAVDHRGLVKNPYAG